jgi:plasmid stabilization system protein ParE
MSAYALTPLAKADIFDIWSHIADGTFAEFADGVPLERPPRANPAFRA